MHDKLLLIIMDHEKLRGWVLLCGKRKRESALSPLKTGRPRNPSTRSPMKFSHFKHIDPYSSLELHLLGSVSCSARKLTIDVE